MRAPAMTGIIRIVLLYAAFAALWILLSDEAIGLLFDDPKTLTLASTLKGWAFVAVTSLLLLALLRNFAGRLAPAAPPPADAPVARAGPRSLRWGVPLLAATIVATGAAAIVHAIDRQKTQETERLKSIAELKATQIRNWLDERRRDLEVIRTSTVLGESLARFHHKPDPQLGRHIAARLDGFVRAMGYEAVLVLDRDGNTVLAAGDTGHPVSPELRETVRRSLAAGQPQSTDLYRANGKDHMHLDFAAPVAAGLAVVTRIDVAHFLFPYLQSWPVPSASAETLLFRRDGDDVLYLNELRHRKDTALRMRMPADHPELLAAQALRDDGNQGRLIEGGDYRAEPALGIARAIEGTGWTLMTKLDRSELYGAIHREVAWIVLTGILALFVAFALGILLRQQRELQWAGQHRRELDEKLRALELLGAIADGSADAIFAKDTEGRYLLFNKEAERVTGKTAGEVLGRDDTALFPPAQAGLIMANDRQVMADDRNVTFQEDITTVDGETTFLAIKGPLHDADGKVIGLFGISRDITERRRAESALKESEGRFRALIEQSLAGIYIIQDGNFRYVNPGFAAIFGYGAPEEIIDRVPVADLVAPEDRQRVADNVRRRIEGQQDDIRYTFTGQRRDGSRLQVEVHGRAFDYQGRPAVIGLILDVTARKQAEDTLRIRNEELERFNRAMVGRELDMIELKKQVNDLSRRLGLPPPYPLDFLDEPPPGGAGQP